jgi:hypothetical protein
MRRLALVLGWMIAAPLGAGTFVVYNTNDAGPGSLRQAILDANEHPGLDDIVFRVMGDGVQTIRPTKELPLISDAALVDGYTQPGSSPNTQWTSDDAVLRIEIDGELAASDARGLVINGSVTVRGLVINRFTTNVDIAGGGRLEGCFIGTDPTGTIRRSRTSNSSGVSALGSTVGGTLPSQRNVISGHGGWGINPLNSIVQGNFIGVDASGTAALPNGTNVVMGNTFLGGPAPQPGLPPGNVISGARTDGVRVVGPSRTNTHPIRIQGNLIGTNSTGTAAVPNGEHGIVIWGGWIEDPSTRPSIVLVGGSAPQEGNLIAHNLGDGIATSHGSRYFGSRIRSNRIHSNGGLGIDHGDDGVSPNEPFGIPNYPILTAAYASGETTTILGTLDGSDGVVTIEFFSSGVCDESGYGEGATLIGSTTVTTDSRRITNFGITLPLSLEVGSVVTSTASTPGVFSSSEFSPCQLVTSNEPPIQVLRISPQSGSAAGGAPVTVMGSGFLPGASLTIGGATAQNVTVVSPIEIRASSPALPPGTLQDVAVTGGGPTLPTSPLARAWLADFLDVPRAEPFHDFVEKIFRRGITTGYGNGLYGIHEPVTRAQMAVFLLRGLHGPLYTPPPCTGIFADVACAPQPDFAVDWIEQLSRDGISAGCYLQGSYCPDLPVRRDEMAVFLLRARYGSSYQPPPCIGIFADVECSPTPAWAVDWVEGLYNQGFTAGCLPDGHFCPSQAVTRGQMAVFLVRTFAIP